MVRVWIPTFTEFDKKKHFAFMELRNLWNNMNKVTPKIRMKKGHVWEFFDVFSQMLKMFLTNCVLD